MRERSTASELRADDAAPPRVALADDDGELRELVATTLRERGLDLIEASDGAALLAILRRHEVDLVITDLWMPSLNGSDVVITRRGDGDRTPVVLITAAPPWITEELQSIEALTVVRKPFSCDALLMAVERALGLHRHRE